MAGETGTTHCGYKQVYQRDCTNLTPCPHHSNLACTKCQNPATGSCSENVMGFFCCEPLCDNCQHSTHYQEEN